MLILSVSNNSHDAAVAVADEYRILSAIQSERLTRVKGDGGDVHLPTIHEALRIADVQMSDVDVFVMMRGLVGAQYLRWSSVRALKYAVYDRIGVSKTKSIVRYCRKAGTANAADIFRTDKFKSDHGIPKQACLFFSNHHFSHALSALFFTDWTEALLYTADGGGDSVFYSMYDFRGDDIRELYGDRDVLRETCWHSLGLVYGNMTEVLGYKMNRHEGKLTGLAAYGKPTAYDTLASRFSVSQDGMILSDFTAYKEMQSFVSDVADKCAPEDAAASVQKLLEDLVCESIAIFLDKTERTCIGLAGGVFANVALNRKIAELPGVEEVFIFPGMGDEGLAVGGVYQWLLERDGLEKWQSSRYRLPDVYWGGKHDEDITRLFDDEPDIARVTGDVPDNVSRLLEEGAVVALFHGRMEFGPRALGARSILASPVQREINDTLNHRLGRTEFMPFAPYVLEEDADDVFELPAASRYAARFMTITCKVRPK